MSIASPDVMAQAGRASLDSDRPSRARRAASWLACCSAGAGAGAQPPPSRPDTRLVEAERALTRGELARAFELGSAYVKAHPREAPGRVLLARVHLERGELDQAYEELDRALRTDPRNVDVLAYLGLVSGQLAARAFERLTTEAPGSARVLQLQGETFEAQERRKDAETAYQAALAVQPDLLDALLPLAKLKRIRLACEEALVLYEQGRVGASHVRCAPTASASAAVTCRMTRARSCSSNAPSRAIRRAAVAWAGLGTSLVKVRRTAEGIAKPAARRRARAGHGGGALHARHGVPGVGR